MAPLNDVLPSEIVNVFEPRVTVPEPLRVIMEDPVVVPEISNVPSTSTVEESAMAPEFNRYRVLPEPIVVVPE